MTSKRKLIGRLVPCRCFRGEEEIVSVLDYSHCGLQQVPKEVFNFERTLEELYLDANQIEELPKVTARVLLGRERGSGVGTQGDSLGLGLAGRSRGWGSVEPAAGKGDSPKENSGTRNSCGVQELDQEEPLPWDPPIAAFQSSPSGSAFYSWDIIGNPNALLSFRISHLSLWDIIGNPNALLSFRISHLSLWDIIGNPNALLSFRISPLSLGRFLGISMFSSPSGSALYSWGNSWESQFSPSGSVFHPRGILLGIPMFSSPSGSAFLSMWDIFGNPNFLLQDQPFIPGEIPGNPNALLSFRISFLSQGKFLGISVLSFRISFLSLGKFLGIPILSFGTSPSFLGKFLGITILSFRSVLYPWMIFLGIQILSLRISLLSLWDIPGNFNALLSFKISHLSLWDIIGNPNSLLQDQLFILLGYSWKSQFSPLLQDQLFIPGEIPGNYNSLLQYQPFIPVGYCWESQCSPLGPALYPSGMFLGIAIFQAGVS
ncbi:hypothetical protein TURU_071711 [Turdus rufiventris]|nr:hypothetical protein TURU_071711 [Turdus rufiventris]